MNGPDTKYQMMWRNEWRPVTNMWDIFNDPTTLAARCVKAVLYINDDEWVVLLTSPGEIIERFDRDPYLREWETLTDPKSGY